MAFTAMFESGGYVDSLSFFGVHRTAASESQLAIMAGTGKHVNAKGYATIKTFPGVNQHETDGVETLLQFTLYLAYRFALTVTLFQRLLKNNVLGLRVL
ncbi:hypothetical protein SLE2022_196660 [Rubroshorea leprosula]